MNISNEAPPTNGACNITDLYIYYYIAPYDVVLHVFNILFGLPTHSYILWLIVRGTGRGIASEFFTLNISVCEIMLCLRSLNAVLGNVFPKLWTVMMFLSGFVMTARFFQCLMCVERYLAVVHPVTFLKYKPLRYRVACSVVTWIMIIICCVFSLELVNPCFMRLFKCMYLSHFIIFLSINLFCCVAVLRALKHLGPGERGREREEENHMKRRAFHLILITTVTLVITYVPSSITALQYILSIPASQELESMTLTCFFLPGFVQPLLFIHRVGKLPFCRSP
ncbi:Chemokine XC receptor 1 [Anabarilius grahami]|uniref:Chemokine XC receptor 1 n=1 Tax=Anabarilius grahami TaxID=495550 RepID=A0A3N0XSM7_ANAGA|nr:Chemokine XC receptor 1 [Anabarilius grahami]